MSTFIRMKIKTHLIYCFIAILCFSGCSPLIANYDQYSYTQTTSLKVDAVNLMGEATEDYKQHEAEVKLITTNIQKLMEYEKHLAKNEITTGLWKTLSDTSGNLFGGFIKDWKQKHTLKPAIILFKQQQISEGFDKIIYLETQKIHK
jgi:hypothetical protein